MLANETRRARSTGRGGSVEHHQPIIEKKQFGKYLRRMREERKLSLDAVEEMSLELPERVTKSHLSRIENGRAIPDFPRMFTLSQIYGIPVSDMAERFEICIKQGRYPADLHLRPVKQVLEEAKQLRRSGRHSQALLLYEALRDRYRESADGDPRFLVDLRLECVNCLVKLSREASAKEECERLLSSNWLQPRHRVVTFQYLAICCYRLSKFPVALMAIEKAEEEVIHLEDRETLAPFLASLRGALCSATGKHGEAVTAFGSALRQFDELSNRFESCRTKLNLAAALIETGAFASARKHLGEVLEQAEAAGYDRQRAFALSHLAVLAFREDDHASVEAHCLRSNRLARSREYLPILFRNCFYLWKIAKEGNDPVSVRANERTLRTYLNRVEEFMPEAEEFRAYIGGGPRNE